MTPPKLVAWCCLAILIALYVVGAVSHGSLRHEVQTLPLWIPIVLGFRDDARANWCALPCFLFWLAIVAMIWAFLLNIAHIVSGHFSPTERTMTGIMAIAGLTGLVTIARAKRSVKLPVALGLFVLLAALQFAAFRLSLLPNIAHQ